MAKKHTARKKQKTKTPVRAAPRRKTAASRRKAPDALLARVKGAERRDIGHVQLEVGRAGPRFALGQPPGGGTTFSPDVPQRGAISDLYVVFVAPDGTIQQTNANTIGRHVEPPVLPPNLGARATAVGDLTHPFGLPAQGGGYGYRAVALHTNRGGTLVIAVSLKDTLETLRNVFVVEAVTSVFVLRIKHPDLLRPYRTWGYPFTPLLYVAAAVLLLGNMLVDAQSRVQALAGIGIILLGIPAWAILRKKPHRT